MDASIPQLPQTIVHASTGKSIEPILLMDLDENGRFVVSKRAIQMLQSIETDLAVVSVAGQYRTGKSFLLNRFAGQQRGFAIGPSTNPCTKGIWLWGEPIPISENLSVILLDTEGLHSFQRDENVDAKLFVLTCLLSSTLIYNVMNVIDERALDNLSFVTNLSRYVAPDVSQYLPNFVWVIRDFALDFEQRDLQNHEKQPALAYMENALRIHDGQEMQSKNEIRMAIIKYFKQRDCYTLVRPVHDERQLRQIDQLPYHELRKEFRQQMDIVVQEVFAKCQPKVIAGVPLNGRHFCELIASHVQTLNNQGLPSITSAWERIVDREYRQLKHSLQQSIVDYVTNEVCFNLVSTQITPNLPVAPELLQQSINKKHQECQDKVLEFKLSADKQIFTLISLRKDFEDLSSTQMKENVHKSKKMNNIIANKMIEVLSKASETQRFQNITLILKECVNLKRIYFQEAQPPTAYEVYVTNFVENLLRIIERVFNNIKMEEQSKCDALQAQISTLQAQNDAIERILKQEKESLNKQIDNVKNTLIQERQFQEKRFLELQNQIKSQRFQKPEQKNLLFSDPEAYIQNQQLMEDKSYIKELQQSVVAMSEQLSEIKNFQVDVSKDMLELQFERKYDIGIKEVKRDFEEQNDRMKISYETEIKILKEERTRLDDIREKLQIALVEKDCEVRLLKERIKGYEKQKSKEIEHADMMCKISEQLLKVMRKIDNR